MDKQKFKFVEFKAYAKFLLDSPEIFTALIDQYIHQVRASHIPLLSYFSHLSDEQFRAMNTESVQSFLKQTIQDKAMEEAFTSIEKWKADQIPGISKENIEVSDLVQAYSIRKQLYVEFADRYTLDLAAFKRIVKELEVFHTYLEEYAFQTYADIQQEVLFKEKEFISSLISNSVDGILAFDTELRITEWNSIMEKNNGIQKEAVIGKKIFDLFPAFEHTEEGKAMIKIFTGEHVFISERPFIQRKGYYEANIIPLYDKSRNITGGISIIHDTTHRKTKEIELEEKQQEVIRARDYYIRILEDFPALVWRAGLDTKYDYFNKSWLDFTGRSLEEELGDGWAAGVHPDDLQEYYDLYINSFHAREPFMMEYRLRSKDGSYRHIIDFGKPMYGLKNEFMGYIGAGFDIQERKDAESLIHEQNIELAAAIEELQAAEEQLKEANTALEKRVEERTYELAASEEELRQTLEKSIELNDELAERENFLNNIIEQSPVSIWIADAEGTQIRLNKACMDLFGVADPDQGIGKYNILKDNTLINTPFYHDIAAVFKEGKIAHFESDYDLSQVEHVDIPGGKPISLIVTIFPIKNALGKVTHAVVQHENVTEKKKAERALKQSEEQLRLITDALPVLIAYVDTELRYQFVNQEYENWFKVKREDMIGKHVLEIVGHKAYENVKDYFARVLSGEKLEYETLQDYGPLGKKFVNINLIPRVVDDKVVGFYALVFDISERKEIEDTLQRLYQDAKTKNEELKRINTDLDNFIYTASHDLRSPITNLEGLIYMLKKKYANQENGKEKPLDMMETSIVKLKNTIDDLVEITKVQKEIEQQTPEKIAFTDMIEDVKADIQPLLERNKTKIKGNFHVAEIKYARSSLRSILYNLLSNAIKYKSPDRPLKVEVSTFREGDHVVLSVKDNGLGMSETQQKKLFTMFSRMHSHVQGTGVGLYMIKRIIENNKGMIKVKSAKGVGSEFKVYFKSY